MSSIISIPFLITKELRNVSKPKDTTKAIPKVYLCVSTSWDDYHNQFGTTQGHAERQKVYSIFEYGECIIKIYELLIEIN